MPYAAAATAIRFEHRTDPGPVLAIATRTPRLSWRIPEAEAGFTATAYEVEVTPECGAAETFAVESSDQVSRTLAGRADPRPAVGRRAARTREAFAREYVTAGGRVLSDAQTAYALALEWALLPGPEQRARAGSRLADLVRSSAFRISTGFVGIPLIADALTAAGKTEVAYRLLLQTGVPSWFYPVTMGATSVWERWDSLLPDGNINPGEMTSFNHYALGAVADWLHRRVAGLAPAAPGYREVEVGPRPDLGVRAPPDAVRRGVRGMGARGRPVRPVGGRAGRCDRERPCSRRPGAGAGAGGPRSP